MEATPQPKVFKLLREISKNKHLKHFNAPAPIAKANILQKQETLPKVDYEKGDCGRNLLRTKEGYITVKDFSKLGINNDSMGQVFKGLGKAMISLGKSKMSIPIDFFEPRTYLYQ